MRRTSIHHYPHSSVGRFQTTHTLSGLSSASSWGLFVMWVCSIDARLTLYGLLACTFLYVSPQPQRSESSARTPQTTHYQTRQTPAMALLLQKGLSKAARLIIQ